MTATAALPTSSARGIGCMLLSLFALTCADAVTKWLGATYPPGQVICIRAIFAMLPLAVMIAVHGGRASLRVTNVRGQATRALLFAVASSSIALSMILLPLADAAAILHSGPLFITALAGPMLGERIGWHRWTAVLLGFCGVLIMLRPTSGVFQVLGLIPLGAALISSLRDIVGRKLSRTETTNSIMFYSNSALIALSALSSVFGWSALRGADLALMAVAGCLVGAGQFLLIEAYRHAEAAVVAPLKYSGIVWAVILGYVVWGNLPDRYIIAGGALVIGSGLYILHRETMRKPPR
ncbi:MAG: DMT family transporter [Hyphomicrobiaceae bacterium]